MYQIKRLCYAITQKKFKDHPDFDQKFESLYRAALMVVVNGRPSSSVINWLDRVLMQLSHVR